MLDYEAAVDEMFGQLLTVWGDSAAIVGYVPEIRYPGIVERTKPPGDKFWLRASQQSVLAEQTSLSNCVTPTAAGAVLPASRFTDYGLLAYQLFCPRDLEESMKLGRKLSKLVRSAYRGKKTPGGVWFRNVEIKPLESEELWNRFNVVAEYEYDESA